MQPDIVFSDADSTLKLQAAVVACTAKELRLATTDAMIRRALLHDAVKDRLVVNGAADYTGGVVAIDKLVIAAKQGTFQLDKLEPDKNGNIETVPVSEIDLLAQIQELRSAVANLNKTLGSNASGDNQAIKLITKLQSDVAGHDVTLKELVPKVAQAEMAGTKIAEKLAAVIGVVKVLWSVTGGGKLASLAMSIAPSAMPKKK